jgi:curved DNA-binding protein CbpA
MFFQGINNFEELKKEYRRLAKLHHPDREGGSDTEFKKLNSEYEKKTAELLRGEGEAEKKEGFKETAETMAKYKDIIDELLKYNDINIEICGLWLWIDGNTKPIKEKLKKLGCLWASKKEKWYYRPPEYKSSNHKSKSMDYIRDKYGSEQIKKDENKKMAVK